MDSRANLAERVRAAWVQALPSTAFDAEMSWRDAGLDSLKALELALNLEQALGRKVTFDGLAPDCTPNDLVRHLGQEPGSPAAQADPRYVVFFLPGLTGDNPGQAAFRHALRREVRFETLDVGGVETPGRVLGDIPARATRLVEELVRRQPHGEIRLTGCSFGALVAQEMTRQLEARGRVVAFLGLLDGFLTPPVWKPLEGSQPKRRLVSLETRERWKLRLMRWTGPALQRTGALELARWIVSAKFLRDRPWARVTGVRVLRVWGYWAIESWRPGACRAATLLIASDEFPEFSSVEGWRSACPRLTVVRAPGRHVQLFDPPALALLIPAFLAALVGGVAEAA